MRNCGYHGVQAVQLAPETVFQLCNKFVQNGAAQQTMRISTRLSADLSAAYAREYTLPLLPENRGKPRLIHTIHTPNKEDYIGKLEKNIRETVEERQT
jgi:hypothetical protein